MSIDGCSKCGGLMTGPVYSPGQGCSCHPEALVYTCRTCGYRSRRTVRSSQCEPKESLFGFLPHTPTKGEPTR